MNEGTITLTVEAWSNNGNGKWRSRQKSIHFSVYDAMTTPADWLEHIVTKLRDDISRSDQNLRPPKT